MHTPNPKAVAFFTLLAALALPAAGCDLLGLGGEDGISDADLEDLRELLEEEFGCDEVEATRLGASESGALTTSDCEIEGEPFDFYAFQVNEDDADVQVDLESDDFDALLILLDENLDLVTADDDSGTGLNARIETILDEGLYVIVATSLGGDTGDYRLRLDGDAPDDLTGPNEEVASVKAPVHPGLRRFLDAAR